MCCDTECYSSRCLTIGRALLAEQVKRLGTRCHDLYLWFILQRFVYVHNNLLHFSINR